jgi:hypothetical protein
MKKILFAALSAVCIMCFAFAPKTDNKKVTILISHEVKDYSAWKKGFDADETNRAKAGLKVVSVYRSAENPNVITGLIEAPSAEVAQKFLSNPNLKSAMEKAGVISAPEIKVLNRIQ